MTPAEALRQAAIEIQQRGWTQGTIRNDAGNVCAVGALHYAVFGKLSSTSEWADCKIWRDAKQALWDVLIEQYSLEPWRQSQGIAIGFVNDKLVQSAEELISCMEKAATRLEEKQ